MRKEDITNQYFNNIKAIKYIGCNKHSKSIWLFNCFCGNDFESLSSSVKNGRTKSCGCLKKKTAKINGLKSSGAPIKHGLHGIPEYNIWRSMKQRCLNKNCVDFKEYGGRGITICENWKEFINFYKDMGSRPSKDHSIDRIDNNLGYYKQNCRWATHEQQANNRRKRTKK